MWLFFPLNKNNHARVVHGGYRHHLVFASPEMSLFIYPFSCHFYDRRNYFISILQKCERSRCLGFPVQRKRPKRAKRVLNHLLKRLRISIILIMRILSLEWNVSHWILGYYLLYLKLFSIIRLRNIFFKNTILLKCWSYSIFSQIISLKLNQWEVAY